MIHALFVVWQVFLSLSILGMFLAAQLCVHMVLDMTNVPEDSIKATVISWTSVLMFMYLGGLTFNAVWSW